MAGLAQKHRILFYGFWLLIGLVQASFTELLDDEAYYWVFSRFLDWGYFDHPPMTALLIKMGYSFFQNELGVRLLIVLLSTLTIYFCELLLQKKEPFVFYAICFSMAVLQIGGFLAVPDIPLMFFTALFFLCYKRFVKEATVINTLLLGFVAACLLYSKYHAVLIVLFTLLSNFTLFKKGQTYAAGLVALLLFVPHLLWQYNHDWISFRYHLFESNVNPYKISYTTDYLLGQLLIAGPVVGFIFWVALFRYHTTSATERALKFTGIGIFFFFLLSSFRGRVEANWTAPAMIPLLVLSHQFLLQHLAWKKWMYRLLPITVILVIAVRIVIVVDILPAEAVRERFHQYKGWPQELRQKTNGLPVVFNSSYQKASKYWFYSGQMSFSLNQYFARRNNYNFWPVEDSIFNNAVYVLDHGIVYAGSDSILTGIGKLYYALDSSFHSFGKLMFRPEKKEYEIEEGKTEILRAAINVPLKYEAYLSKNPTADYPVKLGVFQQKWVKDIEVNASLQQLLVKKEIQVPINPDLPKGVYYLRFAVGSDAGFFTHNSDKIKLEVR
jgi:hypothetical protein